MTVIDLPPPHPSILLSDKLMAITNLNNIIPVKLDVDEMNYSSWVYFFTHFCRGNTLMDHLDSKGSHAASPSSPPDTEWMKIDSILLSWIFVTISKPLQQRLVVANPKTALEAWETLAAIFADNKRTRSIALKAELRSLKLGDMGIDAYFQKIESIFTILNSLGASLDDADVVTFALEGLPSRFDNVATIIAHRDPFLDLKTVRSMLTTEEMQMKARSNDTFTDSSSSSPMALLANAGPNHRRPSNPMDKVHKPCNNWSKGSCRFGASCRFLHNGTHGLNTHLAPQTPTGPTPLSSNDLHALQNLLAKFGCTATTSGQNNTPTTPPIALVTGSANFGPPGPFSGPPVAFVNPQVHSQQGHSMTHPPAAQFTYPTGHLPANYYPVQVHQQQVHQQQVQQPVHPQYQVHAGGSSAVHYGFGQPVHSASVLGPAPVHAAQSTQAGGSLGATMGQETVLPHAFATTTLHEPAPGNWNMDTGSSDPSGAAPL